MSLSRTLSELTAKRLSGMLDRGSQARAVGASGPDQSRLSWIKTKGPPVSRPTGHPWVEAEPDRITFGHRDGIDKIVLRGIGKHPLPPVMEERRRHIRRICAFSLTMRPDGSKRGTLIELIQPEDLFSYADEIARLVWPLYLGPQEREAEPAIPNNGLWDLFAGELRSRGLRLLPGAWPNPPEDRTSILFSLELRWSDERVAVNSHTAGEAQ